jgi:hypothetical protein
VFDVTLYENEEHELVRLLVVSLVIAAVVFLVTGGHVIFLPLVILPLGLLGFGRRRPRRRIWF